MGSLVEILNCGKVPQSSVMVGHLGRDNAF